MALLHLFLFLTLVAAVCSQPASVVSFISFRPEPIKLYWFDATEDSEFPVDDVPPYHVSRHETHVGHVFVYYVGQERHTVTITEEKQVHLIPAPNDSIPVVCSTTEGDLRITVQPSWSPYGAARFLELVALEYFDGCALNRVVKQFLTQFGISADYSMRTDYRSNSIPDDVARHDILPFQPGYMAYAGSGLNSRSTEMFIVMPETREHQLEAFGRNSWETPFATLHPDDLAVVAKWFSYGDMPPWGTGPDPQLIYKQNGYEYLAKQFPEMSYIRQCKILPQGESDDDEATEL